MTYSTKLLEANAAALDELLATIFKETDMTPNYPTLTEAENAVAAEVTALTTGKLNTPDSIKAAWIVCGYVASLGPAAPAARLSPKAAPNINWANLIQILLPVLLQLLGGLGNPTTSGS